MVNVWAAWCDPCKAEAPLLHDASQTYGDRVQFLGVDILDSLDGARGFIAEHGLTYPSIFDPAGAIRDSLGMIGQPVTVFYDAERERRVVVSGPAHARRRWTRASARPSAERPWRAPGVGLGFRRADLRRAATPTTPTTRGSATRAGRRRRPPPSAETRKLVSVVFCDLVGSTELGASIDPESLRKVMTRYYDEMRGAIERHGGTVEKFIGDAVVAVFGIPRLHEDDAVRAVRAATEMRDAARTLECRARRRMGRAAAHTDRRQLR